MPIDARDYDEKQRWRTDATGRLQHPCALQKSARPKDPAVPDEQRQKALKFIVHLVGDVNQPHHTVFELQDFNGIMVCFFSSSAMLGAGMPIDWAIEAHKGGRDVAVAPSSCADASRGSAARINRPSVRLR
jgi:hypothetical protein